MVFHQFHMSDEGWHNPLIGFSIDGAIRSAVLTCWMLKLEVKSLDEIEKLFRSIYRNFLTDLLDQDDLVPNRENPDTSWLFAEYFKEELAEELSEQMSPQWVEFNLRQAVQHLWVSLPPQKVSREEIVKQLNRLVDRVFENAREDEAAFS